MSRVLCIGDPHEPVSRKGYLDFCTDIGEQWGCNEVVCLGDLHDHHGISFWAHHPECPGPSDEYELAYQRTQRWYKRFPKMKICIGNHDERVIRVAEANNIMKKYLRDFNDVWQTPKWDWRYEHIIDNVMYLHGTGSSGKYHSANLRDKQLMSVVAGHVHTAFMIHWIANVSRRIFGMNVGCGIDDKAMQFAYGKHMKQRSMLGCAVVIDGMPYLEPMPCGKGEKYHDSRFK